MKTLTTASNSTRFALMLSEKQKDFLDAPLHDVDFLEGTIRSGKTFIAAIKFMLQVMDSEETQFVIACKEATVAERNIINAKGGILETFTGSATYKESGQGGKRIIFDTPNGEKTIYVVGFSSKDKWKNILGMTIGGALIDEINIASIDFVREMFGRTGSVERPFIIATANPDNPNLPVYSEFLNGCRPLKRYTKEIPQPIINELKKRERNMNWAYWFFTFHDNPIMTDTKIGRLVALYDKASNYFKTKILGIRGRADGIIYRGFDDSYIFDLLKDIKKEEKDGGVDYQTVTIGVDYGATDATSFTCTGFWRKFLGVDFINHYYYKNKEGQEKNINEFVDDFFEFAAECYALTGKVIEVYVDSANKSFYTLLKQGVGKRRVRYLIIKKVNKKGDNLMSNSAIKDRIEVFIVMMGHRMLRVDKRCKELIAAIENAVWDEKGNRLDDDTTNVDSLDSMEYSYKRYMKYILKVVGLYEGEVD